MITILFFASLRELTGLGELRLKLEPGATVETAFSTLQSRYPQIAEYRNLLLIAVNQEYATWEKNLESGDEVALFPPVSGG